MIPYQISHSFDIFDTVLTRRLSCPADVFTLVSERLSEEGIRVPPSGLFRKLRIRCERWARRLDPSHDVLLPDIYGILGGLLFWSDEQCHRAAQLEREMEASMLQATIFGRAAVQDARVRGARIAFVSDMYLEEKFLRSLLEREELAEPDDLIAVSGEWKCSKAGGTIWPELMKRLNVSALHFYHQGDNQQGDVASPQKYGITAKRLGTSEVSRWESWSPGRSPLSVESWGGIAALSRMARSTCANPDDYWTQLGAGVLGPLLAGFASWSLAQAKQDGIHTLWYLSRDGWLFYRAAELLNRDDTLRLQYVGVNRLQLRYVQEGPRGLAELYSGTRKVTWDLLSQRLRFSTMDMQSLQLAILGSTAPCEEKLTSLMQSELLRLLELPEWQALRVERAREAGDTVKAYIAQCQGQISGTLGIVDVGWAGRTQDALEQFCPALANGYYLGLSGAHKSLSCKKSWLFDADKHHGRESLNFFQRMIEVLIGGVSGPLLGYERTEQQWQPKFANEEQGEKAPGRERMQAAALAFVELCARPEYADWWSEDALLAFTGDNLSSLLEHATGQDAGAFEDWWITTDDAHQDPVAPARGFDLARVLACLQGKEPWAWVWPQASLKNSTLPCRFLMKAAWICRSRF